jgi:amidase
VGLKPTIGLLSRTGIVPISGTLDTPGPMTRSVVDNAILLSAMMGKDAKDPVTRLAPEDMDVLSDLESIDIRDLRLGANANFLESDSLYKRTVELIRAKGATVIVFTLEKINLDGFISILNYDMQRDLPAYFKYHSGKSIAPMSVADVIDFNNQDTLLRAPYGQGRLIASRDDHTSDMVMDSIKNNLEELTRAHFTLQMEKHNLDAILSINNYESATAALAKFPCLSMPMGYTSKGEPKALTFIGQRFKEKELLQMGSAFERAFKIRVPPKGY